MATPRQTEHQAPTRRRCPRVTLASGWRAVSLVPASGPTGRASAHIDFDGSPRPTIGVEWEFALVDAQTRDLSNEATAVIAEIGENPRVNKELLRNTVEGVRGMELFCAGTHPFARWSTQELTDAPRYAELIKRTQWWVRQMLIWGVHVHVGV